MSWKDTFFDRLEHNYINLTEKQKKLADYIRINYRTVVFLACVPLAKEVGVSEATVVRFANALGYEGFTEMINHIREYMKNEITTVDKLKGFESVYRNANVVNQISENNIKLIKSLQKLINPEKLNQVVDDMLSCRKILLCGFEGSSGVVEYMGYNMIRAGCYVDIVTEKYGNLFNIVNSSDNNTYAVIVAFPRYPDNIIKLSKMLYDNGVNILIITDSIKSPVLEYGKYSFIIPCGSRYGSTIDVSTAVITLFQIILFEFTLKNYKKTKENLDKLEDFNTTFDIFYKEKK